LRVAQAGGTGTRATVLDINAHMLAVDYPVPPVDAELYIRSPHPMFRFEVAYVLASTERTAE